jgi:transcriptional regulator with GAF, ATPase, and Fis domain
MFNRIKANLFEFLNMHTIGWLLGFLAYKLNIIKSSPALYKEIKILNILKKNNITVFVETGTYKGKTAIAASPFVKRFIH